MYVCNICMHVCNICMYVCNICMYVCMCISTDLPTARGSTLEKRLQAAAGRKPNQEAKEQGLSEWMQKATLGTTSCRPNAIRPSLARLFSVAGGSILEAWEIILELFLVDSESNVRHEQLQAPFVLHWHGASMWRRGAFFGRLGNYFGTSFLCVKHDQLQAWGVRASARSPCSGVNTGTRQSHA